MTKIRMNWKDMELTAEGHSGGGERGKDIICAGISALTQALLNQLLIEDPEGTRYRINEKKGSIRIRSNPMLKDRERIRNYFRVIITGLRAWEQAFPDNVKMEEVNEDGIA